MTSVEAQLAKLPPLFNELANLEDKGITAFKKRWNFANYSSLQLRQKREQLRLVWLHVVADYIPLARDKFNELLGVALPKDLYPWEPHTGDLTIPILGPMCEVWLKEESVEWQVFLDPGGIAFRLFPKDWHLPVTLVIGCCDLYVDFKYCWNPDCRKPYFLSRREDKRYCSKQCALPAQRASKRKWAAKQLRKSQLMRASKRTKSTSSKERKRS